MRCVLFRKTIAGKRAAKRSQGKRLRSDRRGKKPYRFTRAREAWAERVGVEVGVGGECERQASAA